MTSLFVVLGMGLLFGIGLILSGMSDPSKVLGFLDLAGRWDPSLAFVMGGAVLLGGPLRLPTSTDIDRRLVVGGLTFGAGWGLAGYCPGPALASLAVGGLKPLLFCAAMLVGMALFELLDRARTKRHANQAPDAP